jgi:hypothetical protein
MRVHTLVVKVKKPHTVVFLKKGPRHAVCSAVLNLLSQVGFRLRSSALAEAYRVTAADMKP